MTMLAAIRETIVDEMARDDRVVLLGEDVGVNG
jgi:pyruvate/2-oxoglutarate/acetoin dehydrogenase E1 component